MPHTFKSGISWWLFAPILGALGFFLLLSFVQHRWLGTGIVLLSGAFIIYLLMTTRYTISPQDLLIESGPICKHVPLASIISVAPSRNPISSPALSLDRLEIRYGKYDSVLISPADKAGFLTALHELNPALRHD